MENLEKIVVSLKDSRPLVKIGWTGENDARGIVWDISTWQTIYGEGICTLLNQREQDTAPYPCSVTIDGKFAIWRVTDADLGTGGNGKCQLIYQVGEEVVAKSPVYKTLANRSLSGEIEPPDQFDSWIDQIVQAGAQAQAAASTATSKAGEAAQSATSAAESAQTAQTAASTATSKAGEASQSATSAAESAQTAQEAASTATSKAEEASSSAAAAAGSKSAAAQSAKTAQTSATQAAASTETAQAAADTATAKAREAVESATAAAASAQAAQASADSVAEVLPIPTVEDNGKILTVVDGKWAAVEPGITSWEKVQLIVRAGLAPQYFPVGYEFVTHDSTEDTDIIWRVIGFDTIKAADESLTHSMILETKYAYSHKEGYARTIMYGFKDALYYAETGLTAGTYHFTLPNTYPSDGGGKTYSFTLTQPVPAGGLVDFEWFHGAQAINSLIKTYVGPMDIVPIETASLTEGNNGTYLGTADGTSANMNIDSRVRYGSNNYAQGVMRKWLNTAQTDPFVWATPETKFNRFPKLPGLTLENRAGFLSGLPEDFLAAVQTAAVPNRSNAAFETASLDGTMYELDTMYHTYDQFFLLHRGEISEGYEGFEVLEYYKGATNADIIKYAANGTAVNYWLRSCHSTQPGWASSILTTGAPNSAGTTNIMGVCPVCIIA